MKLVACLVHSNRGEKEALIFICPIQQEIRPVDRMQWNASSEASYKIKWQEIHKANLPPNN